jgi:hypothetical protein
VDSDVLKINKTVRRFDRDMFAKRDGNGVIRVYHKAVKYTEYCLGKGEFLMVQEKNPYHVFSLTETWGYWGDPVTYGSLPLNEKLYQISLSNRDKMFAELEASEKKAEEDKRKSAASVSNDMARQAHEVFKEATKDVVFSNMDKKNDKRRKYDKRIKGVL